MQPLRVLNLGAVRSAPGSRLGQEAVFFSAPEVQRLEGQGERIAALQAPPVPAQDVGPEERQEALKGFLSSANDLEGWKEYLATTVRSRAKSVLNVAEMALDKAEAEMLWLNNNVWGRTGNPDAEEALGDKWIQLANAALDKILHPPSVWESLWNAAEDFVNFLIAVGEEVWKEFVSWAEVASKPILRQYYDAAIRLIALKEDLAKAKASGGFSETRIREQESAIANADATMDMIRKTFSTLTGGMYLDDYVQIQWGAYPQPKQLGALVGWPGLAISGAVMFGIIIVAVELVDSIDYLTKETPGYLVLGLVGLGAILALPLVLRAD